MIELAVSQLKKQFGETVIFENITFEIKSGERVGLIGANGVGKTTAMKIVMGLEDATKGEVFVRKGAKVGCLNQIPEYSDDVKAMDVLKLAFSKQMELKKQLTEVELAMSEPEGELESLLKRHESLSVEFERLGGYMIDTELNKILTGLQISDAMANQTFNSLSGGEQTRIVLGKILLEHPDVLLLDEPSNHLDIKSIEWLEGYLESYTGAVLIISHDRYFLDKVVNRIVELTYDEAIMYHGNYTYYTAEKERRFLLAMKYYEQQQKKVKRMEEQIKRYRIWGEMRDSDKMYRRAKELEKRLEKMEKVKKPIYENRKVSLSLNIGDRSAKKVIEAKELRKSYDDKEVLAGVNLELGFRDYLCVLGDNGCGKTTLFQILMDRLAFDGGSVKIGNRVTIGYLPQQITFDNEDMTILEYFTSKHPITNGEARKQLAKALFVGDDVFKKVKVLSGGEKSRLKLNTLMYGEINLLLLDEPTNHLDIDSREVLEENLLNYKGSVLFISHDRYFVDKMATKVGEMSKGKLKVYSGNYAYYKSEKAKTDLADVEELKVNKPVSKPVEVKKSQQEATGDKVLSKNAIKQLGIIESDIEELEGQIEELEGTLISVGDSLEELNKTMEMIDKKKIELEILYEKWEKISL